MRNIILILLLVSGTFSLPAQIDFNPDVELNLLAGEKKNIGVLAGYSIEGEVWWKGTAGMACADSKTEFDSYTQIRIASISKNFTAVAMMQLAEKGLITLDARIGDYLTDIPEDKKKITVRQLMAHTSGIPQYQNEKEIENKTYYPFLEEAVQIFIKRPLLFEPGTEYFYTTYGYVILGRILEIVTGISYEKYMKKEIFDVAGMTHTEIEYANVAYDNKACLYQHNGRRTREATPNDLSNRIPGGGFHSTLDDLIRFGNAILDEKLITRQSLEEMLQIQPVEYTGNKYGLGWYLYGPRPNEALVIGHSGGQTGCTSQLLIVPRSNTVVVVLSNTSGTYPEIVTFASHLIAYSEAERKQ